MPWRTIEIDSWSRFTEFSTRVTMHDLDVIAYLMRGQADESWPLMPSLLRNFPPGVNVNEALKVEKFGISEFRMQAHLHLPVSVLPSTSLSKDPITEWWALMQHHNAPTRLLDWTLSPYVAAYYAVERELDKPGTIFIVHPHTVMSSFREKFPQNTVTDDEFLDPNAPTVLMIFTPNKKTDRFVAQQSCFTLSVNILGVHDELIEMTCGAAKNKGSNILIYEKLVIPSQLKLEFLRNLRAMNIAAHSLFPGIDGLGRSLSESARLLSVPNLRLA
jgi:hypothetical protein